MKTIEVVAAILMDNQYILATQRLNGEFAGGWEFPGGKIEANESCEDALSREIKEELGIEILIHQHLCTTSYTYPSFHLTMHTYLCSQVSGTLSLIDHSDFKWLKPNELDSLNWLPADIEVVEELKKNLAKDHNNQF